MHRIEKLLGMILIFGIVFFIICDEKGYKVELKDNQIIFDKPEKKSELVEKNKSRPQVDPNAVYKNSDWIHLNYEFENPKELRKSDGIDSRYVAKLKKEKELEKKKKKDQEKVYTGPSFLDLDDNDSISSVFEGIESQNKTGTKNTEVKQATGTMEEEIKQDSGDNSKSKTGITIKPEVEKKTVYYPVERYEYSKPTLNMKKGADIPMIHIKKHPIRRNVVINLKKAKEIEPIYKNSNAIELYSGFENPRNMRKSAGIDEEYLAKMKENSKLTIVSLNDNDTISNALENNSKISDENSVSIGEIKENINSDLENYDNVKIDTGLDNIPDKNIEVNEIKTGNFNKIDEGTGEIIYEIEKYEPSSLSLNINKGKQPEKELITIDKPEFSNYSINLDEGKIPEKTLVKIEKYQPTKLTLNMKKGKKIESNLVLENSEITGVVEEGLSDPMLEKLLENEEIDIDTLESENDEFLQKVFEKTRDIDVMNLIVETYLNEYQFVKAKKFIEELPEMYRNQLNSSLNLRVAFNSFSLSSTTVTGSLSALVQEYSTNNKISEEDKNRYLGVIALMDRNYDNFFEISKGFTSEKNKTFTLKLQSYKDQISKQMGMPDYYFDTLVSLELFNQGLFQPAKVLALYSLQKNANYILPYQVLAYANFLTNSRDSSIEYLKKLMELDSTNAEKYRFLVGVASYRDEKYEQSVVMLSMIKDDNLRLDAQRYLINDYIKLDQKTKLITTRNKLLGYQNLVASDFYTYFYEAFYHPYSEGKQFQIYAFDVELANKMLRVCSMTLSDQEKAVCTYGTIGRNIALGQFDGIEQYLLDLVEEYPQGYLYQALGDYYVQQGDLEKAKAYLLKAVSLTQKRSEINQIKKLLQDTM